MGRRLPLRWPKLQPISLEVPAEVPRLSLPPSSILIKIFLLPKQVSLGSWPGGQQSLLLNQAAFLWLSTSLLPKDTSQHTTWLLKVSPNCCHPYSTVPDSQSQLMTKVSHPGSCPLFLENTQTATALGQNNSGKPASLLLCLVSDPLPCVSQFS